MQHDLKGVKAIRLIIFISNKEVKNMIKKIKKIIGFFKMKYEQFIIREVDRLDLASIWYDQEGSE